MSASIRVMIVDDHPMMREGLGSVITAEPGLELVAAAGDGVEAVAQYRAMRPDVTLMDLQMPNVGGIEAIKAIREEFPTARILVLSTYRGDVQVKRALDAGACGYLLKSRLRQELVDAIRNAFAGGSQIDAEVAAQIQRHEVDAALSRRELEVLSRVATGGSNKVIAAQLGIAEDTVKSYMKSILAKLHAKDRAHAVRIAIERGIISLQ